MIATRLATRSFLPPAFRLQSAARHASSSALKLKDPTLWRTEGFLNGTWSKGKAVETFAVLNPGNGKKLGSLPDMGLADTKEAIEHAHKAFATWGKTSEYERAAILNKLYKLLTDSKEDLAQIITAENGKPLADARGEVAYGASFIEWFAGEAIRNYGDVIPSSIKGVQNLVIKHPVGVCGIITPWNFPHAMVTRKLGAALAAGCTVVASLELLVTASTLTFSNQLKAPSETPYSVLAIVELARQAGVPDGVINVVLTEKHVQNVGRELCENPHVHKVSFTGSTRVGKILMQQSSSTLKKLSMELGGNAPLIVFDDADLDKAVAGAILSKFRQVVFVLLRSNELMIPRASSLSGQTCVCANRIFVQDGVYDQFAAKFVDAVRAFSVGEGTGEGITHGPLIHQAALDKVGRHVEDAKSKGAKVLVGGARLDGPGFFYQRCAIDEDETFGPVAALYRFKTEEEVIARANEPSVGLAAYFFSESISRVARVSAALEVGMVGANTGAISQAAIPFGGVGQSGFGREGSKYGLAEYQTIKLVAIGGM